MDKKEFLNQEMHPVLKSTIENLSTHFEDAVLVSPEVAVIASSRADYSGVHGVPKWSSLRFVYLDEVKFKEWQYSDAYSHHNNRWDLLIRGFEKVTMEEVDGKIIISAEVKAAVDYPNRTVKHSFPVKDSEAITSSLINEEEVEKLEKQFQDEVARLKEWIMKIWEQNTHTMPTPHGHVPYRQPRIKGSSLNKGCGIGIFITEEQIDFHFNDPQMKQEAYIVRLGEKARMIHQESAYLSQGSPDITVISIEKDKVVLGTERGSFEIRV